jgi:hypothetical protein
MATTGRAKDTSRVTKMCPSDLAEQRVTLFDIADSLLTAFRAIEETDDANDRAALEQAATAIIETDLARKVDGIAYFDKRTDGDIEKLKELRRAIDAKIQGHEDRKRRMRQMVLYAMQRLGVDKLRGAVNTFSIRSGSPSLVVIDENAIPAAYKTIVTSVSVNNAELKKALLSGADVPGAGLRYGDDTVQIR